MSKPTLDPPTQGRPDYIKSHLYPIGQRTVLNAYALNGPVTWQVQVYQVEPLSPAQGDQDGPRDLKGMMYDYARRAGRGSDRWAFWRLDDDHVAAPVNCQLPAHADFKGYSITPLGQRVISTMNPANDGLVREILKSATREALRRSSALGQLIQDGSRFIAAPSSDNRRDEAHFCRQIEIRPRPMRLADGERHWTLQMAVHTVSIDVAPLSDYYQQGQVELLAALIRAKRKNRRTRAGEPTSIRVLYQGDGDFRQFAKLTNPEQILEHADHLASDQRAMRDLTFSCEVYRKGKEQVVDLPGDSIHLVLDTQVTGENHDETILDVSERLGIFKNLRSVLQGHDIYGLTLDLEPGLAEVESEVIRPPSLLLKGRRLEALDEVNASTLRERIRARNQHVRKRGYLHSFDINPLVAVPKRYGQARGEQLVADLQAVINEQGLEVRLAGPILYDQVEDIQKGLKLHDHDALIAVLPEGRNKAQHVGDTHEQIKKRLSVTSQCIHFDNTRRLDGDERRERGARFNYQAVILNLLVKHGWVPFLPAEPSHYNVRFGIDVGGILNDKVMVCLGYGFSADMPIFRAEEIEVGREQAEPILDGPLYLGMNGLLSRIRSGIVRVGITPDFNRVLFFRDGDSNGQEGLWQERDAFTRLHAEFRKQGWVNDDASWVLVEISKQAQGWRQLRLEDGRTLNPLIGTISFPFDDQHSALISTTGSPTLDQGTAQPLLVKMSAIAGTFDPRKVAQDLLWEADLCFTKLDHGYALPFTLHVADAGALQLSRTYQVSGLTL